MKALATFGPSDKPEGQAIVEVIRKSDIPSFYIVKMDDGRERLVHVHQLKLLKDPQDDVPNVS